MRPAFVSLSAQRPTRRFDRSIGGAASYGGEDRPLGTIGVIGPSRMSYSKVIPLVDFTADVITEVLPRPERRARLGRELVYHERETRP